MEFTGMKSRKSRRLASKKRNSVIEQFAGKYADKLKALEIQTEEIAEQLCTQNLSLKAAQQKHKVWMELLEELLLIERELLDQLDEDEDRQRVVSDSKVNKMIERKDELLTFKYEIEAYMLKKRKTESQRDDDEFTSISKLSKGSKASSRVSRSSAMARLEEATKKAELETRGRALKEKQELARKKLELEQREEELEYEVNLAVTEARSRAIDQFEGQLISASPVREELHNSVSQEATNANQVSTLRPTADEFVPRSSVPESVRVKARLHGPRMDMEADTSLVAQCFKETIKESQLPKLELKTFEGDPLEFQQWLVSFEKLIEDMTTDASRRLHYLLQYTAGEANTLVSGYTLGQTDQDYQNAKAELKKEFGNHFVLARAMMRRIETWAPIKPNDGAALTSFVTFLKKCKGSMPSLKHLQQLNTDMYLQKIVAKLPFAIQGSWRKLVCQCEEREEDVDFAKLVSFIDQQAHIAKHPVFSADVLATVDSKKPTNSNEKQRVKPQGNDNYKAKTLATHVTSTTDETSAVVTTSGAKLCPLCKKPHDLDDCHDYLSKSVEERKKFLIESKLCFCCYGHTSRSHSAKSCKRRLTCKICGKTHPTGLHGLKPRVQTGESTAEQKEQQTDVTEPKMIASFATAIKGDWVAMSVVMVKVWTKCQPQNVRVVYAALDSLSSACFIDKDVWSALDSPGFPAEITVKTMTTEQRFNSFAVDGLCVSAIDDERIIMLPKTYTQDRLPIAKEEIASHSVLKQWPHLTALLDKIPERDDSIPIGLLIGANCAKALEPQKVIPSEHDGPFAVRTALGWCISGPVDPKNDQTSSKLICHRTAVVEETNLKEMIVSLYESDFVEPSSSQICRNWSTDGTKVSQEDVKFMSLMNSEAKFIDGHYQLPLPFRDKVVLPNNRTQALQRANGIKKRFIRDAKFRSDYTSCITDLVSKGYARKVLPTSSDDIQTNGKRWYIPHHGVYHPAKPEKIRVVFDCSCQYAGSCLNKELLQGPNLTSTLVGVLVRFRQEQIAFMADIESMFHQVRVPEEQRDYLRFVWWPDGDIDAELEDYQMCVHLFGGISSPSCASFALRKTADDNEHKFGSEVANSVRKNFYVDDLLKSKKDVSSAVIEASAVRDMCAAGGFRLTKFVSNSRRVLESIPVEDRAKDIRNLDLSRDALPLERALGVHWCVENDTLGFKIALKDKPLTRRGVLSTISSIYDPLGLASPFLLSGRKLLQRLCSSGGDWDELIPDEERMLWERWRLGLPILETIEINRCFEPTVFGEVTSVSIHHFSDASQEGYGQCSYIRLADNQDKVHCSLVMGKSRVPPTKPVTIPRLELAAATVSAKIGVMLRKELEYDNLTEYYWTDSQVVLGYINNDAKRFHTYVANRVQLIRQNTEVQAWKYVDTKNNPADDASRGLLVDSMITTKDHRWFKGPDFLWLASDSWPQSTVFDFAEDDREVKKPKFVRATNVKEPDLVSRIEKRFSDWHWFKRSVAILLKFVDYVKNKRSLNSNVILIEDLERAELEIIKSVQRRAYAAEMKLFSSESDTIGSERQRRRTLKKSSQLYRLDPFIDGKGVLRIGGRLKKSSLDDASKHPIVLPKLGAVTSLIVRWCHEKVQHSGRGITLNEIRARGYWIIHGNSVVRSLINRCVKCRSLRGRLGDQKMADLPEDRVESTPPFTYCAVDLFGPFVIKEGRKEVKRYGCLFTCMASRAIHIETTNSLETDAFINALRRFIARRGNIRELRSDNGTNFVGANAEMKRSMSEMNQPKIREFLHKCGADFVWKKNPPAASHMGGVWERQIGSARAVLASLLKTHGGMLDDELFRTLLVEVEAIVNCRPLTIESLSDARGPNPISPNDLLTMKSRVVMPPPGCFQRADLYCRRRWRRVQHIANEFWARWRKEYLASLQPRSKSNIKRRNFKVGDIVLLKDGDVCRNDWPMAKVIDVHWDSDHDCVRSVQLLMSTQNLNSERTVKERAIDKLVLLLEEDV